MTPSLSVQIIIMERISNPKRYLCAGTVVIMSLCLSLVELEKIDKHRSCRNVTFQSEIAKKKKTIQDHVVKWSLDE